jgi:hypothetical protein
MGELPSKQGQRSHPTRKISGSKPSRNFRQTACGLNLAARSKARAAWRLIDVEVAEQDATFTFALNRDKLRKTRRREGRYLLRTNLCDEDPAKLWKFYIQLVEIEIQMLDGHFPTTDGRTLILSRYTELNADQKLVMKRLKLDLPSQSPPRTTASAGQPARVATQQA